MEIKSKSHLKEAYNKCEEGVRNYFEHIPRLLDDFPMEVCLAYVFSRLERGQLMAIYCGMVKLHKVDSELARTAVEASDIDRKIFLGLYKRIFTFKLSASAQDHLEVVAKNPKLKKSLEKMVKIRDLEKRLEKVEKVVAKIRDLEDLLEVVNKIRDLEECLEKVAEIRDLVIHGKPATDDQIRNSIAYAIKFAEEVNKQLDEKHQLKPFGDLRGFAGRLKKYDERTSKFVLKGMGLEIKEKNKTTT